MKSMLMQNKLYIRLTRKMIQKLAVEYANKASDFEALEDDIDTIKQLITVSKESVKGNISNIKGELI